MFFSNKRQRIEKVPKYVSIRTWLRAVQEYGYVLGKIETNIAATTRVRSRSLLHNKLAALEMKAHPMDADVNVIIADLPKGERNRNPTDNQYSIKCPSFGWSKCTKTFCVDKKWWDIRPLNSDGTSNQLSVHWSSHFKGFYDTKEIPHLVLKMVDNYLHNLY